MSAHRSTVAFIEAARIGFRDIEEGRFRNVEDGALEEFISRLGQPASARAKNANSDVSVGFSGDEDFRENS